MASEKLEVPGATRVGEDGARALKGVAAGTGLVDAPADREVLNRIADIIREHWQEWCGRGDSNPHALASVSPSSWCVCQFRHFRTMIYRRRGDTWR